MVTTSSLDTVKYTPVNTDDHNDEAEFFSEENLEKAR